MGEGLGEVRGEVCGDFWPPLSAESFLFSSGLLPEEAGCVCVRVGWGV